MTSSLRYGAVGTAVVVLSVLAFWPFLNAAGRRGILIAACVALPIQIASFAALRRFRGQIDRFLVVWVGGTLIRMVAIGAAAFVVIRADAEVAVPMLLALASFFFGLLLLEPIYFRPERRGTS